MADLPPAAGTVTRRLVILLLIEVLSVDITPALSILRLSLPTEILKFSAPIRRKKKRNFPIRLNNK